MSARGHTVADLAELQYQLDDGPVFGRDTPITVQTPDFGTPGITDQDAAVPRADGTLFGRDTRQGRTITFDMNILMSGQALDALDELTTAWLANQVRMTPGAYSTLRMCRNGRTRRVYGRPRKFASTPGKTLTGWIPVTAEFVTKDHVFYDDVEQHAHMSIVPPTAGGLALAATTPFGLTGPTSQQSQITVGGSLATPMRLRVNGPIVAPRVSVVGVFDLSMTGTLASDDWVDVDALANTAITRFGENWAGKFTHDSPLITDVTLPPGPAQLVLYGTSLDGTASLDVWWRNAFASY